MVAAVRAQRCAAWAPAVVCCLAPPNGAPTSAEWNGLFVSTLVSPIPGTEGPAPAGRSFPVQSQRSHCAINSLAVLAGAPRTVAVCSCYRTKRKPQPMGTTRRAVTHTCERSTAPGLSCAALLRVQTQGSEYVPVVRCQGYTACLVIGCSGFSGACCRQQTALWSQGHPPLRTDAPGRTAPRSTRRAGRCRASPRPERSRTPVRIIHKKS